MTVFVLAVLSATPFVQWRDVDTEMLLDLVPWIVLILLLIPRRREAESPGVPWLTVLALIAGAAGCSSGTSSPDDVCARQPVPCS